MALAQQLAIVPDGVQISASELTRIASALSKQVNRDFRPIWSIDATVDAFAVLEDVPIDYWPIIVVRNVQGAAGYHVDEDGQPYALVEHGPDWSLTASHECLEMLADPFGSRLKAANILDQALDLGLKPARVRYLVEVCDPSEAGRFGYHVNSVLVSDFYTPDYFDPVKAPGVRYSFTGAIDAPRTVLTDGYISWQDRSTGDWWQLRMFPDNLSAKVPHVVNLTKETVFGQLLPAHSVREAVDRVTRPPAYRRTVGALALTSARGMVDAADAAQIGRADALRRQIAELPARQPAATGGGSARAGAASERQRGRTKGKKQTRR